MASALERQEQSAALARQPLTARHVLVVVTGILCLFGPAALVINTWSVFLVPVTDTLGISSGDFTFYVTLLIAIVFCTGLAVILLGRKMGGGE